MKRSLTTIMVLIGATFSKASEPINVLIITGDHGHAWRATTPFLKDLLTRAGQKVEVTESPAKALVSDNLARFDVLVLNYKNTPKGAKDNPDSVWSDDNKKAFSDAIRSGTGLVVYHHASSAFIGDSAFDREFERISAGGWRRQGFHGKMHEFTVRVKKQHAITQGLTEFKHGRDELYQNSLVFPDCEVLVAAYSDAKKDPKNTGKDEPMVWISTYGKGRVCQNALGHDVEAMKGSGFQTLFVRCVEWAATGNTLYPVPARQKTR